MAQIWLHTKNPDLFEESGALLVTDAEVYDFITSVQRGEMALSSEYPMINDVLSGEQIFEPAQSDVPLSYSNGHKYMSALTDLHTEQHNLLKRTVHVKLRQCPTMRTWEHNLKRSGNTTRHK